MGKVLGGGLGLLFGGPLGAVVGVLLGHGVDSATRLAPLERRHSLYFVATFSMLGKLAKADGVVSESEIEAIERVMRTQLRLSPEARRFAIDVFNAAKDSDAAFGDFARQFHDEFRASREVLVSLVELLLIVAHADRALHPREDAMIREAVTIFGIEAEYAQMLGRFDATDDLTLCYRVLGAEPTDSLADIKRNYRRLVMEHHPDRITAKGMAPEFVEIATAKFKEIQHAWDVIEKHRRAEA